MTAEFQMDGSPLQDSTVAAGLLNSTASMTTDGYDSRGAAMFTIAVILTYTLSIICLIASFSFQKKRAIQQDQEATNYLKYRNEVPRVMSQVMMWWFAHRRGGGAGWGGARVWQAQTRFEHIPQPPLFELPEFLPQSQCHRHLDLQAFVLSQNVCCQSPTKACVLRQRSQACNFRCLMVETSHSLSYDQQLASV